MYGLTHPLKLHGSLRLESLSVQCFASAINSNEDLKDIFLPHLHALVLQLNEFHTIIKRSRIPNAHRLSFSGENHPASGEEPDPAFNVPHLFAGLPLPSISERPVEYGVRRECGLSPSSRSVGGSPYKFRCSGFSVRPPCLVVMSNAQYRG